MRRISRSQWAQIAKRVHLAGYSFDPEGKCLIDGRKFKGNDCPHTVSENEDVISSLVIEESI